MYIPYRIPTPTFKTMGILSDHIFKYKEPIGHNELAALCGTTPLGLIAIVKRMGRDAVALGTPFLDAWIVNDETRKPNWRFLQQKIELGYTDGDVDFDKFWLRELKRFWY